MAGGAVKRVQVYRLALVRDRVIALADDTVSDGSAARRIAHAMIGDSPVERLIAICMSGAGRVLAVVEVATSGGTGRVDVAKGAVAKVALAANAAAIVLAHNHPSGSLAPSADDVAFTASARAELAAVGVVLHEHFIVTPDGGSREVA